MRYKGGYRRSDPERHSFAFFVVGALLVIAIAFFLGLQVGRVVEKNAAKERAGGKSAAQASGPDNSSRGPGGPSDIRREMSAFSEEAVRIPAVPPPPIAPPTAGEELKKTEASATFRESLSRKDPSPQPLVKPLPAAEPSAAANRKFLLQAGAMKNAGTAEAVRNRLSRAGYKAKVIQGKNSKRGEVYRVRVGPFASREEAAKAMKSIKSEMKIDVILLAG